VNPRSLFEELMRSAVSRFVLLLLTVAFVREARAADAQTVKIDVQVISATTGDGGVDKRLEKLRDRLSEYRYSSYQLVSEQTVTAALNSSQTLELPEKHVLVVTPKSIEPNGNIRVHLNVRGENKPNLLDTTYTIAPGKDLVVGVKQKDGGAMMIALRHRAEK
jgi:hypothetical protein